MSSIQYQRLKKYMSDSSYTFTDEWLSACVDWVKDNYTAAQITDDFLKTQIYDQWLGADLGEMESNCLPGNLDQKKCIKLTGRFGLQINSLQDIGESSYSQLNKLKKTDNENTSVEARDSNHYKPTWEPKQRRCLYLSLTDGSQNVFGLEMTSIPSITLAVKPGAKILILGPVECRRGVIQLKPANVKFLGGEVEQLAVTNSVENVLARNLHQPENTSSSNTVTESQLDRLGSSTNNTQTTQQTNVVDNGEFPDDDDFDINTVANDAFSDDDLFMDIDENALIASATDRHNVTTQLITQNSTTQPVNSFYHPNSNSTIHNSTFGDDSDFPSPSEIDDFLEAAPSSYRDTSRGNEFLPPRTKDKPNKTSTNKVSQLPSKSAKGSTGSSSSSSKSSGFKNVKSEVGKQLKIEKYLRPMPVVIDPATPEREARKRLRNAKRENESNSHNIPESHNPIPAKIAVVDPIINNSAPREEIDIADEESDDSLMDMIETSINEQLKTEDINIVPESSTSCNKIKRPISVSKHPYVFLKQIQNDWDSYCSTKKVIYVKACIATLVSNIKMEAGQWALDVCVNDGSGFLNCTISSSLLNEIIGFSPTEMKQLKKAPNGKTKIAESMKGLTSTLIHWNGIFGIEIGQNPLVIDYKEVMIHNIASLKERLSQI